MSKVRVSVPDIGGDDGAEVIELLVAVGDEVAVDQSLIVLESDKASMEIPSTVAGTVVELLTSEGAQLTEGSPVVDIEVSDGKSDEAEPEKSAEPPSSEPQAQPAVESDPGSTQGEVEEPAEAQAEVKTAAEAGDIPARASAEPASVSTAPALPGANSAAEAYAGPAVRKLAREFGVPLEKISGSGPRQRILKEDLHKFVRQRLDSEPQGTPAGGGAIPGIPEQDFSIFGEVEVAARSRIAKLVAANMHRSWLNVPHVTQFDQADITDLEVFRNDRKPEAEQRGTRLTPMPFLLKACAVALRDNPKISSSLAAGGDELVYKKYCHIGIAVDTEAGLLVPVIRDVDKKTVWDLAAEVLELAEKARSRKIKPAEMAGGCFSISSLGNIGGSGFTPIVNTPEVAILGVSRATIQPVWNGSDFAPRNMLPLSLSYDHRVIDGADAGRFLTQLTQLLGDIRQLVM